jgi:hypothetical protein
MNKRTTDRFRHRFIELFRINAPNVVCLENARHDQYRPFLRLKLGFMLFQRLILHHALPPFNAERYFSGSNGSLFPFSCMIAADPPSSTVDRGAIFDRDLGPAFLRKLASVNTKSKAVASHRTPRTALPSSVSLQSKWSN